MSTTSTKNHTRYLRSKRPPKDRSLPPRRIDVPLVRIVLEQIAAEEPEHRDGRITDGLCARYIHQGQPNCFVARVLDRLGFSIGVLKALDAKLPIGEMVHTGVRIEESDHPALRRLTPNARQLLAFVQRQQDRGWAWGKIVRDAFSLDPWVLPRWNRQRKPWLYPEPT